MAKAKVQTGAVFTADIAVSARMSKARLSKAIRLAEKSLEKLKRDFGVAEAEIFRGDSMQGVWLENRQKALAGSLWMILQYKIEGYHLRCGVGCGAFSLLTGQPSTSNGAAFVLSGEQLDALKKSKNHIGISASGDAEIKEWDAHSATLNYLLERCTQPQAEALGLMLEGMSQVEIAVKLSIKQPAVSQRLQAAGWQVILPILQRFEYIATTKPR